MNVAATPMLKNKDSMRSNLSRYRQVTTSSFQRRALGARLCFLGLWDAAAVDVPILGFDQANARHNPKEDHLKFSPIGRRSCGYRVNYSEHSADKSKGAGRAGPGV